MARAFEDLVADLSTGAEVKPRCTGEEMALHLGIASPLLRACSTRDG
ncbi:hypothetical protein ACFWD7_49940 [Streptomyces mirabilis]